MTEINKYLNFKNINILLFIIGSFLVLQQVTVRVEPILAGDCREYILITEAFSNHGTPDIRMEDINSSKHSIELSGANSSYFFDNLIKYVEAEPGFFQGYVGIFCSKSGLLYGYHFWFYSLLNVPVNLLLNALDVNTLYAFPITNALFVIIVFAIILFGTSLSEIQKLLAMVLFIASANAWYMLWIHPEIYSSSCLLLALIFLIERKYHWSVLLAALGSFQNPPIAFVIPLVFLRFVQFNGIKIKQLIFLFLIALLTFLPSAFYYYHFGVTNLILKMNFIEPAFLTFRRLFSLLFDLNQGMIIAIAPVLIIFIFGTITNLIKGPPRWSFLLWLPVLLILMSIPTIQQTNWNMGSSIVSRYVVWMSMIPIVFVIYYFDWNKKINMILMACIFLIQVPVIFSFNGFSPSPHKYIRFNKLSSWVLDHSPYLYNPDPEIFAERTLRREGLHKEDSPIIYISYPDKKMKKIMVHEETIDSLYIEGIDPVLLKEKTDQLRFNNGWAYININSNMRKQVKNDE